MGRLLLLLVVMKFRLSLSLVTNRRGAGWSSSAVAVTGSLQEGGVSNVVVIASSCEDVTAIKQDDRSSNLLAIFIWPGPRFILRGGWWWWRP